MKIGFSVDASIIDRLGNELVSKKETALAELIKNAYDADATEVNLVFKNSESKGVSLEIMDNGTGMTKEELINGFLRIASSTKINEPYSKKYKRKRAGRKGIGRFAVHRLGKKLTVITQTKESNNSYKLKINWNDFIKDKNLDEINATIEEIKKEKEEGTILVIENLRDKWTESDIKNAYKFLKDVLQPFPLSKQSNSFKIDPGFKVKCYKDTISDENLIIDEEKTFFDHALAELDAYVDRDGKVYYKITSNKLNFEETGKLIEKSYEYLKENDGLKIKLKAYYFLYDTKDNLLPKSISSFIKAKAKKEGGIRIYKNGFRIMPYGDPIVDDWLGLDRSVRKRTLLPAHGNINFFGFIEIQDIEDKFFPEKSDREGFIENKAFRELQDFGYRVIEKMVVSIAHKRGKKAYAHEKNWEPKLKTTIEKVNEIKEKIKEPELKEEIKNIAITLNKIDQNFKQTEQQLLDEIGFLRVLASMGLSIGEFVHEVKHMIDNISHIESKIENYLTQENKELTKLLKNLKSNLNLLKTYIGFFDRSISATVSKELSPINLRAVINDFKDMIKLSNRYANLDLDIEFDSFFIFTTPMHLAEIFSILMNLFTNSIKAIKRAKKEHPKIKIKSGINKNIVYIEFSDNGDGISNDKKEKIFEKFYTTSLPHGKYVDDYKELTGMGLGLKIIKDIITAYNGKIFVKDIPENGYSTTFRIELPKGKING